MHGKSEGPIHAAGLDAVIVSLKSSGWRVRKSGTSLPPYVFLRGESLGAGFLIPRIRKVASPAHRDNGPFTWKLKSTPGQLERKFPGFDLYEHHTYRVDFHVDPTEMKQAALKAMLAKYLDGPLVKTGRKVPDVIAWKTGRLAAVEYLRGDTTERLANMKRAYYNTWPEVAVFSQDGLL